MRLVVKNRPGSRTTVTLMAPTGNRTTETLMERRRTFAYGARRLSTAETGAVATCEISVASAVAPLGTSLDCQFVGPTVGEIDLDTIGGEGPLILRRRFPRRLRDPAPVPFGARKPRTSSVD